MTTEKTEKPSAEALADAAEKLLTDDVKALIDHPVEVWDEDNERYYPAAMKLANFDAIRLYNERFVSLKVVWQALIDAMDARKSSKTSNALAELKAKIVSEATEEDLAETAAIVSQVNGLLDSLATSDVRNILVSEMLSRLVATYDVFSSESIAMHHVPAELREQNSEEMLTNFQNCHASLKTLQTHVNASFAGLHENWDMYKEFFDADQFRLNDKGLPMHPEDGRQLRSKYAHEAGDETSASARVRGLRALDYSVGYKFGRKAELVRNLATDYRDPQFALPNFLREVNREMREAGLSTIYGYVDSAVLVHLIRASNPELAEKSDTDCLATNWQVVIPGTIARIRRMPAEPKTEESETPSE